MLALKLRMMGNYSLVFAVSCQEIKKKNSWTRLDSNLLVAQDGRTEVQSNAFTALRRVILNQWTDRQRGNPLSCARG